MQMQGAPILLLLIVWIIPFIMVLLSEKVSGREKMAWLLGLIFISWFAWVFYLLLAPLKDKKP